MIAFEKDVDKHTRAHYESRARVAKALAHPSRLLMVEQIAARERCVLELTEMVGADMSTVSKHLGVLKAAGIVKDERRGAQVYYSLRTPCVVNFFACLGGVLETLAEERRELVSIK